MPDLSFITDFISDLLYGSFFSLAKSIWNGIMDMCFGVMSKSPQDFSAGTWEFVEKDLYPWALSIGILMVNLFFLVGFCKSFMNLKEHITLELCVETMIRLVCVNALLRMGMPIMKTILKMAAALAGDVIYIERIAFFTEDGDIGSHLFWWMLGFLYFLVAVICAFMIFLTVYGRYVKLYLLVVFFPFAMPTVIGGRGIEASAYAWVKTFLSNTFEIVAIALTMAICGRLIAGITISSNWFTGLFDGANQAFNSLVHMILMTASVKSASSLINKAFAL